MKQKTLRQISLWLICLSFFMPLLLLSKEFIFPFIVPKILMIRSISLILFGLFLLIVLGKTTTAPAEGEKKTTISLVHVGVLGFVGSFIISTFLGVDWYRSMWDNHERMLGLFTVVHYVLFYIAVSELVVKKEEWQMLFKVFLGAGTIVMFVALLQQFDNSLLLNQGRRSASTLGNSIYVSGYGLFLVMLALYAYIKERHLTTFWKWSYVTAGVFGVIGIFAGGSRGTVLGLLAALVWGLIVYTITVRMGDKKWRTRVIAIFAVLIALSGVLYLNRDTQFVKDIPAVGRLLQTKFKADNTRVLAWGIGLEASKDHLLFGWGPNNYYYAFNEYYRPEFLRHGYGETWFDNAHNIVVDTITTRGIVGIVTYISLFVAVVLALYRLFKDEEITGAEFTVLSSFFVGHFIHNVFVFENPTSYLYFFFLLAYVQYLIRAQRGQLLVDSSTDVSYGKIGVVSVVVLFFIFTTNINPAKANMATLDAIQALYQGTGQEAYSDAVAIPTPHIDDVRNDFARSINSIAPQYVQAEQPEQAKELLLLAIEELSKNMTLHPMDIRVHLMQANLYQQLAALTGNVQYIQAAKEVLETAQTMSPERQQLLFMLASTEQQLGNYDAMGRILEEVWELDKQVGEGWVRLLSYYGGTEQFDKAVALLNAFDAYEETVQFNRNEQNTWEQIRKQIEVDAGVDTVRTATEETDTTTTSTGS